MRITMFIDDTTNPDDDCQCQWSVSLMTVFADAGFSCKMMTIVVITVNIYGVFVNQVIEYSC